MPSPVLSTELLAISDLLRFDLWAITLLALMTNKDPDHETVWDMTNRICDRYLPK